MPTLVLVSGNHEAKLARSYLRFHPKQKITLVSADIPAAVYFEKEGIPHKKLHQLHSGRSRYSRAYQLAMPIVRTWLENPEIIKALSLNGENYTTALYELLRGKLVETFRDFVILTQACRSSNSNNLVIGQAFNWQVIALVKQDLGIQLKSLSTRVKATQPKIILSQVRSVLAQLRRLCHLLFTDPKTTLKAVTSKLIFQPKGFSESDILVFSNGLNLASYHSIFSQLAKNYSVTLLTDRQSLVDAFYLVKYNLDTHELRFKKGQSEVDSTCHQLGQQLQETLSQTSIKLKTKPSWIKTATLKALVETTLLNLVNSWLPTFLTKYIRAKEILNTSQPKLVITTHDPGPSATVFILPAKKHHISTLVLIHGGAVAEDHFFFSDKELIWGSGFKDCLIRFGIKADRLITAGCPLFYDYKVFFQNRKSQPKQIIDLGIITSGYGRNEPNQVEFFLKLFPELAKLKSKIRLNIRPHPGQFIDGLSALAQSWRLKLRSHQPELLEEFVAQSDIIISQDSSAALVPLIAGRPILYLPADHPLQSKSSLIGQPGFPKAIKYEQVSKAIEEIITQSKLQKTMRKHQQQFLDQYCGRIDQSVGSRAAQTIIKLMKNETHP